MRTKYSIWRRSMVRHHATLDKPGRSVWCGVVLYFAIPTTHRPICRSPLLCRLAQPAGRLEKGEAAAILGDTVAAIGTQAVTYRHRHRTGGRTRLPRSPPQ